MIHGLSWIQASNVIVGLDFRRAKVNNMLGLARTFQWSAIGVFFFSEFVR